jgi:hypothetical protein
MTMASQSASLAEMLRRQEYEIFSRSLHALSHQWMARLLHLKLVCRLTLRLIAEEMPLLFLTPEQQTLVMPCMERWNEIHEQMRTYPDRLRCLLWVGGCEQGSYIPSDEGALRTDIINRRRWQPYDEAAWDAFFPQIVELLAPALYLYDAICREMEAMLVFVPGQYADEPHRLRDFLLENLKATQDARLALQQELDPVYIKSSVWF